MAESSEHTISMEILVRFLRLEHAPDGPHELLGLARDAEEWTAKSISHALLARLEMIDAHPQGRTPEADELRVALHVAAAQLRDPEIRASLLSDADPASEPNTDERQADTPHPLEAPGAAEAAGQRAPTSVGMPTSAPVSADFRVAAQHVLASCGGWNAESKRLLGYLARSASVDAQALQQALVEITRAHEATPHRQASQGVAGRDDEDDPLAHPASSLSRSNYSNRPLDRRPSDPRTRTWMTVGTAFMLLSSAVMMAALASIVVQRALVEPPEIRTNEVRIAGGGSAQQPPSPTGGESEDSDEDREPSIGLAYNAGFEEVVRLLRTLDQDSFARAPEESVRAFEESLEFFSEAWVQADDGVLAVAPLSFRDAVLAAHEHDELMGSRLVKLLGSRLDPFDTSARIVDPKALRSSAFCFGLCGMLLDSPIVPREERSLRTRLNSIASGGGSSFEQGSFFEMIETALRVQASGLMPRAADDSDERLLRGWGAWSELTDALPGTAGLELKLDTIEGIVTSGEDPVFHAATQAVIAGLVSDIDWMEDPENLASVRLLEWFDDTLAVDARDLSVISEELVDGALLPSLDATYKLSGSATSEERVQLRDRYALQFSLPQTGGGKEFASDWAGYAEELIADGFGSDEGSALNAAVRAAWLNESAALWFASQPDAARRALENAASSLDALVASQAGPVPFGDRGTARADGEWAAKYLKARRSADERTRLLYELANTGGPAGQADADVLAEAASYSTPVEIRSIAQRAVLDYLSRPEVIIGLLEVLPRAAKQEGVSAMIEGATGRVLPPVDRQDWMLEARKALVARAMEMLASSEQRRLDVAAEALAASYAVRLDLLPPPTRGTDTDALSLEMFGDGGSDVSQSKDPARVIAEYAVRLQAEASRFPERAASFAMLDEITSRRAWRLRLVSPGISAFTADQTSAMELTAYILSSSRPALVANVAVIIQEAATRRRAAASVFEQIGINEVAVLKLNLLRLTGGENR